MTATRLQIKITEIYRRGKKGRSKSMTVDGNLKEVYNQLLKLFEED